MKNGKINKLTTKEMVLISMFAALTAIGAFIQVPTPIVPFTLQFLFCAYAGIILGSKKGIYSQLLYVVTGLIGIPVFAKGGGLKYIFEPTFGYLIGFILCAWIIGKMTEKLKEINFKNLLFPILIGLAVVYLVGVNYMYIILNYNMGIEMTYAKSWWVGCMLYLPSDIALSCLVAYTGIYVLPVLKKANLIKVGV